jgi:hypothetical protein
VCRTTVAFAGIEGGITLQVGNTGGGGAPGPNAYVLDHDVTGTVPIVKGLLAGEIGPALIGPSADVGGDILSLEPHVDRSAAGQLELRMTSTGGHPFARQVTPDGRVVLDSSAGSCTIYVTYEEMIP